ncbi:hypothetical protein HDE_04386 [Halotydeus destructor]|nr:hypothetical protein HDE_04386 [Halotydeus destructor]
MPHIILYCAFSKLREGATHIITADDKIIAEFQAHTTKRLFGSSKDWVIDMAPNNILDRLEQFGYKTIGFSTYTDDAYGETPGRVYYSWTLSKIA